MRLLCVFILGVLSAGWLCAAESPAFDERQALAKLQAMDLFPDLENENSGIAMLVAGEVKQLELDQPAFFKEPSWPLRVARRVADRLSIRPRTVAEIRASVAESFEVDPEEIQRIHGIRIVSARFSVGGEWLDVAPQIWARVSSDGLVVDYDRMFAGTLGDVSQFHRRADEADADYWKRQRTLLAAVMEAWQGQSALQITFEFQSERTTVTARIGERLTISAEGKVAISKLAAAAGPVKNASPSVKAGKTRVKDSGALGGPNPASRRTPRAPENSR